MPHFARPVSCAVLAATLAISACGSPPQREMQQAQQAIDTARGADADRYAHDEFVAAQEALTRAREAVEQRDYRLALNHALDSRERAQNASGEAVTGKATARAEADRAMHDVTAALGEAQGKLRAVEGLRSTARAVDGLRHAIGEAERAVEEGRAALNAGNYPAVPIVLAGISDRLAAAVRELETAANPSAPRRRR
jgi:hypothetical protein